MSYLIRFRIVEQEALGGGGRRSRRNSDNLTTVVETSDTPPFVVRDLDPRIVYAISVAARNGAGVGSYGPETTVERECVRSTIVFVSSFLFLSIVCD